jgi:hypothetical protein
MSCPLAWRFAGLASLSGSLILYDVLNFFMAIGVSVLAAFSEKQFFRIHSAH